MLIPVTHPTQCVAGCAKCGFSGQANTTLGPSPKRSPIMPFQCGRPNYIGAYVRMKSRSQNLIRICNRVVAYRDCLTHKPIPAQHLVLPDASALPLGLAYRDWLCDGGWTLGMGMGQWDIHICPTWRSVPYSRTDTGNSQAHKFHFGMINIRPLVPVSLRRLSRMQGFKSIVECKAIWALCN